MKLVRYEVDGRIRSGLLREGGKLVDISAALDQVEVDAASVARLLERGIAPAQAGVMRYLQAAPEAQSRARLLIAEDAFRSSESLEVRDVRLLPPIARPGKIVGVGRNYADHAKETGVAPFEQPRIIFKMPSALTAPGSVVRKPAGVAKMDYEGELAVVIGRFASNVAADSALSYVAGYSILNDLSAREFQFDVSPAQTSFAKSMDGFCPLGPALVTSDELVDPQALEIRTRVNGQQMQSASTGDMLFPVAELISYISRFMTLEPGDVVATGTPAGIGAVQTPPLWLQAGDVTEVEVSSVGVLTTVIG